MSEAKTHGINISASVLVSWITIGGAAWLFAKPLLLASVQDAMADEIKEAVKTELAPTNNAFATILRQDIRNLEQEIALLEFRRDNPPADDWTATDAQKLVTMRSNLAATKAALVALEAS